MDGMVRYRRRALAALVMLGTAGAPVDAEHLVTVRVYDSFGLSAPDHIAVRSSAGLLFRNAGVVIRWRSCPSTTDAPAADRCADPLGPNDVLLRMVASPHDEPLKQHRFVLGSVLHTGTCRGSLVTVFVDRVLVAGRSVELDSRVLLGRVIAHELGHLLLGGGHAATGLMRGKWTRDSLVRNGPDDWAFSRRQAFELRKAVAGRTAAPSFAAR